MTSLRDPSSFGPPPKTAGVARSTSLKSPASEDRRPVAASLNKPLTQLPPLDSRGLGSPLTAEEIRAERKAQAEAEVERKSAEEEEERKSPFQTNTTGLQTQGLPKPPVRRMGETPASQALPARAAAPAHPPTVAAAAAKPKPALPPRLPPRSAAAAPSRSPPPSYTASAQNTTAVQRPGGVQTPGNADGLLNQGAMNRLGAAGVKVPALGIGGSSGEGNSSTSHADLGAVAKPLSRLALSSQKPAADSSTRSPTQATSNVRTLAGLHEQHGDKVGAAAKRFGGAASSGLGALAGKKGPPPPAPPKRGGAEAEAEADAASPPPVPMATRPR